MIRSREGSGVAGQKLVGSPLPLVPDDTGLMPGIGEIVPAALGLGGDLPILDQAALGQPVPDQPVADQPVPEADRDRADRVGGTEVGTRW